jgi:helix-turn-helix protein
MRVIARRTDAIALTLQRAERRLVAEIQRLEVQLEAHGEDGLWTAYLAAIVALAQLARLRAPADREDEPLMTTAELARRLNVSSGTVSRARKAGELTPVLARGRVIRWAADSVPRGTAKGTALLNTAQSASGYSLSRAVRGPRRP